MKYGSRRTLSYCCRSNSGCISSSSNQGRCFFQHHSSITNSGSQALSGDSEVFHTVNGVSKDFILLNRIFLSLGLNSLFIILENLACLVVQVLFTDKFI
ncbi:hypothetical protein DPMN_144019 [Dreissena polymorpha]|uniref:Uncharacterized protein n=1 Tax=Dreissena polymorpha TaxID=45954 RepID=A0A9D4JK80_DREPO|nr:hypothetical protein DPMN_144019 [Dreissena polymorpha]